MFLALAVALGFGFGFGAGAAGASVFAGGGGGDLLSGGDFAAANAYALAAALVSAAAAAAPFTLEGVAVCKDLQTDKALVSSRPESRCLEPSPKDNPVHAYENPWQTL